MSPEIRIAGPSMRKLTLTETKMLRRTPAVLFWAVAFPLIGLLVVGLIPGTDKPVKAFGGASVLQTYLPIIIAFTMVMTAVNFLPVSLVTYRERGVLRRMSTTPVRPSALLGAQVVVNLAVQIGTAALVVIIAVTAFGAAIHQPGAFVIAFILATAAATSLGLLIAAVSATAKAANALSAVLFFVLMFFSGLWLPRSQMPAVLRGISDGTPLGAGVQALQSAAQGQWPHPLYLGVLAAYVVVCGVLATRLFRWE